MRHIQAVSPSLQRSPSPSIRVPRPAQAVVRIALTRHDRDAQLATLLRSPLASHLVEARPTRRAIHLSLVTAPDDMHALLDLLMATLDEATIGTITRSLPAAPADSPIRREH
ncbi:hypothetical protein C3Y08_18615 [Burkholderia gladioli]|uniref:hypothetical protein n=1 Tax=Burkholderia gladioli TaxID=28095 RepID=UPI000CDA0698|nr:hypothetical protein [Burkholderia gladioli]POS06501.1 hypothetical protein C3Y08_18615 [Burkholderia gladioli]